MNPRRAECIGLYGYGDGYLSTETMQRAIAEHAILGGFCVECSRRIDCMRASQRVVDRQHVDEADRRRLREAYFVARGMATRADAPARLTAEGYVPPEHRYWLRNYDQGRADYDKEHA